MLKTSEYVSVGHPDKVADYISCYILDRYMERDPNTRYALEVQIKDHYVSLAGEITSTADFTPLEIEHFVKEAVEDIGYTSFYQRQWGKENTICAKDLKVTQHISQQSPDIARGVDADGWGDQGIYWGMAVRSPETDNMPADHYLAKKIGKHLYDIKYAGLDIKTQVTMRDGVTEEIVVAIPMLPRHSKHDIKQAVQWCCGDHNGYKLIINGTGRFVRHGSIGDCGTTGRKLAVDFYGGNCRIGGGSPWTKDGTKADLSLNLLARARALSYLEHHHDCDEVHCAISCHIGSPEITVAFYDKHMNELLSYREDVTPAEVIREFRLDTPCYAKMCKEGLFQ